MEPAYGTDMNRIVLFVLLAAASPAGELVDRIVAVVDDDPIFASDVERVPMEISSSCP
jgi:hypothetical protein